MKQERQSENSIKKSDLNKDDESKKQIYEYTHKGKTKITERLDVLEKEWDIERALELNAAVLSVTGVALALTVHRRWFILPLVATAFLAQHALQGWCPPLPLFKRLGFRSRSEI